jgi:putative tricarboxylic transport membrane protein
VIGAYAIRNSMLDVWIVIVFGFIGYFSNRVGLDTGAMALGIILGPMIEENLGKCVHLSKASGGSVIIVFFQSPIAVLLMVLTALSLATPFLLDWKRKHMAASNSCSGNNAKEVTPND